MEVLILRWYLRYCTTTLRPKYPGTDRYKILSSLWTQRSNINAHVQVCIKDLTETKNDYKHRYEQEAIYGLHYSYSQQKLGIYMDGYGYVASTGVYIFVNVTSI